MQKTYCDRCGAECPNKVLRLTGRVSHTTSGRDSEYVGSDELKPIELCAHCEKAFAQFIGPAYRMTHDLNGLGEAAVTEGVYADVVYGPFTEDGRAPEVSPT